MWRTRDVVRNMDLTIWQQIKLNLAVWFWWKPLGKLARWGFITTPEGCYLRLRDFTPFFWRTLVEREHDKWLVKFMIQESRIEERIYNARIEAVNEFADRLINKTGL